ncbi:MAG TPA: hypothetical protein VFM52_01410 [Rhodanobacter sp.]|nr:hypothetical protein [Rhodanobacter sp.]
MTSGRARPVIHLADVVVQSATDTPIHAGVPQGAAVGRYDLRWGEIACPAGRPETAHQIVNTGTTEMRYLAISAIAPAEICECPDSGKFGAFVDNAPDVSNVPARFRCIGRTVDTRDYREGE